MKWMFIAYVCVLVFVLALGKLAQRRETACRRAFLRQRRLNRHREHARQVGSHAS